MSTPIKFRRYTIENSDIQSYIYITILLCGKFSLTSNQSAYAGKLYRRTVKRITELYWTQVNAHLSILSRSRPTTVEYWLSKHIAEEINIKPIVYARSGLPPIFTTILTLSLCFHNQHQTSRASLLQWSFLKTGTMGRLASDEPSGNWCLGPRTGGGALLWESEGR